MTMLTEGKHAGGFLVWEVLRDYTRETVTIISGAGKLEPGTVLGRITSGGKYTSFAPGASNGSQNASGILWDSVDASAADAPAVILLRGPAIVNRHDLVWPDGATEAQITTATTALASIGIILR
ncbi:head decoration protein [Lentibacter algarum]|jgi:hypothetical protein|uniref:head decoration protein n=1 Tax=Lentibacter algarum TaxID=576131 RepID=UPI002491AE6D|nr:head decoration protein [Lentibacter algarum]